MTNDELIKKTEELLGLLKDGKYLKAYILFHSLYKDFEKLRINTLKKDKMNA